MISLQVSFATKQHDRSQILQSDKVKWPKMTKITLASSVLRWYTHELDKKTDEAASTVARAMNSSTYPVLSALETTDL